MIFLVVVRYIEKIIRFDISSMSWEMLLENEIKSLTHLSRLKDFAPALKHIADIIERGIREHPELSVGMQTEGIEVRRITH